MTCEECLENVGPYADGELPAEERARLEEHLRSCPECAAAHRRLVDTSSQVRGALMRYEAPDVLKARIRASLGESARDLGPRRVPLPARASSGWTRAVAAAAV